MEAIHDPVELRAFITNRLEGKTGPMPVRDENYSDLLVSWYYQVKEDDWRKKFLSSLKDCLEGFWKNLATRELQEAVRVAVRLEGNDLEACRKVFPEKYQDLNFQGEKGEESFVQILEIVYETGKEFKDKGWKEIIKELFQESNFLEKENLTQAFDICLHGLNNHRKEYLGRKELESLIEQAIVLEKFPLNYLCLVFVSQWETAVHLDPESKKFEKEFYYEVYSPLYKAIIEKDIYEKKSIFIKENLKKLFFFTNNFPWSEEAIEKNFRSKLLIQTQNNERLPVATLRHYKEKVAA